MLRVIGECADLTLRTPATAEARSSIHRALGEQGVRARSRVSTGRWIETGGRTLSNGSSAARQRPVRTLAAQLGPRSFVGSGARPCPLDRPDPVTRPGWSGWAAQTAQLPWDAERGAGRGPPGTARAPRADASCAPKSARLQLRLRSPSAQLCRRAAAQGSGTVHLSHIRDLPAIRPSAKSYTTLWVHAGLTHPMRRTRRRHRSRPVGTLRV